MHQPFVAPPGRLRARLRIFCGLVGVAALALAVVGAFFGPADFFRAYEFAALACLAPAMGCLPWTFIHRLTGGAWGRTLGPLLDLGCRLTPWVLVFFIPLLFGLRFLFPWAAPTDTLTEQTRVMLARHGVYFASGAFIARFVAYELAAVVLLWLSRRRSAAWTGPVGLMLYAATSYLFAVDWVMSIAPGWSSTGFPIIFMASQALSALAMCIVATVVTGVPDGPGISGRAVWKDLGNLLLGALMFWAYVAYAQFIVVWSGNLPDQAAWYLARNAGGWHYLLIGLAVFQLGLPVLLLLSAWTKRRSVFFALLATVILFCQTLYMSWLVLPTFRPAGIGFHPLDTLLPLALDFLWLFLYLGLTPRPTEDFADA